MRFSILVALFAAAGALAGQLCSYVPVPMFESLHIFCIAPFHSRRTSLANIVPCNINRFKIVTTLASTGAAVGKIDTTNNDTAAAVTAAKAGLTSAGDGIKTIALALITGGSPPAAARDQVQTGLNNAQSALSGITDPTVSTAVADAQSKLAATIQDGQGVVADC
ncbi:hypothetical protein MSAN_01381600 [Mycena sanguinolenta]|uniref:Uncharacterized protein n=1 Tax=Mycena sanguinolenta TaxID=230812 RepID=A0A8H6YAA4_9AGAR|nr:hypothetical protein MSAN_01381600 [Mycena sanguinolenta]